MRHVIATGETVEDYPDDKPYPSRLVLGWNGRRRRHVVVADNLDDQENIVITVYEPDPEDGNRILKRERLHEMRDLQEG